MTLTIEITRSKTTRDLGARVVQFQADGPIRGINLLRGRRFRKIVSAQLAVIAKFEGKGVQIEFEITAAPDTQPPYKNVPQRQSRELQA